MAGHLLMEVLTRRQADRDENNTQFERHLGIPRSSWVNARSENVRFGAEVLRQITRVYPELAPLAGAYLLEGGANALAAGKAQALAEVNSGAGD